MPVVGFQVTTLCSCMVSPLSQYSPSKASPGGAVQLLSPGLVDTGFAAANTGPTTVDCGLDAYTGTSGRLVGSGLIRLPPGGQLARFLSQLIPGLPVPYQGSFLLRCQRGSVVPVTLTQRASDGAIATVAMSVGYLCQVSNRALLCVSSFNRSPEFSLLSVIEFVEEQFLISLVEILA